jgi:hypothetical protein
MKKELEKSKASFKLDLIETANADPMLSPADFKVLSAYASVLEWPSCRTWLASSLATSMTGLSDRQFRDSRACLLGKNAAKRAYLVPIRQSGKVTKYQLFNPWRDEALAHIKAKTDYAREVARQKKEAQRAAVSRQNVPGQESDLSRRNLPGQNVGCPGKICRSVPAKFAAYTPLLNPPRIIGREEPDLGSNVLPFERRAS